MNHENIKLSSGSAQRYSENISNAKASGISETLDGSLTNYKGIAVGEQTSFEGVEGIWQLKSATPANGKTEFKFTAV